MITVTVKHEGLDRLLARVKSPQTGLAVMRAMGTTLKSITEGNFNSVGAKYRPSPWAPKRDGTPSILQKSTTLAKSFQLRVWPFRAVVSNPTVYAAIHQFGGTIRPRPENQSGLLRFQSGGRWWSVRKVTMPPRPFFPMDKTGRLTEAAMRLILRAGERAYSRTVNGQGGQQLASGA